MTPTHTRKGGRLYRYYIATDRAEARRRGTARCAACRPAEIEGAVVDQVRGLLRAPEMIVRTWRAGKRLIAGLTESEVREALQRLDPRLERIVPGRAGARHPAARRTGRCQPGWRRHPTADRRAVQPDGRAGRGQARAERQRDGEAEDQERRSHHHGAGADFDQEARRPEGRAGAGWQRDVIRARCPASRSTTRWSRRSRERFGGARCWRRHVRDDRGDRAAEKINESYVSSRAATDSARAGHCRSDLEWSAAFGAHSSNLDQALCHALGETVRDLRAHNLKVTVQILLPPASTRS